VEGVDYEGLSNPYLKAYFDEYRSFRTPTINKTIHPCWNVDKRFNYETSFVDCLHVKKLLIMVYHDNDIHLKDIVLGQASIDLHTLATGPCDVKLTLTRSAVPCGSVSFLCEMNEMRESILTPLRISITPGPDVARSRNCYLKYSTRTFPQGSRKTKYFSSEGTSTLSDQAPLYIGGTLYAIEADVMYLSLVGEDGIKYGTAAVPLTLHDDDTLKDRYIVLQRQVNLICPSGDPMSMDPASVVATAEIELRLSDLPCMAQMHDGHIEDGVIFGGSQLLSSLPRPRQQEHHPARVA
jgi:hypothetical protein